jgi:alkylhydroperoxidase family enzyme
MVEAIRDGIFADSALFTDEEKAALRLSLELTRDVHVSDATFAEARRHFDDKALVELVVNVGVANLNNRITEAFWADLPEE